MIITLSVVSFLLDGILSKYILPNSILLPLLTIVSLVIIYPYFNNNNYRYFKYVSILGLLYDIVYMNTIFFNFFIFILIGFIIIFFSYLLSNNFYTSILFSVIAIIIYRIIVYLFLIIFQNANISFIELIKSIYSSLILNIIYCILLYIISEIIRKKLRILRSK